MDVSEIVSALSTSPTVQAMQPGDQAKQNEELKLASQQFEAVLIRQFLGRALKPLLHDSLGSNAPGAHIYQHMITDAIANQLAAQNTFGMSSLLQMQLSGALDGKQLENNRPEE